MGGKTSKSTQTVSIPPEVLARYNAVNARAEEVAGRPFQPYSYNPADFVAQLTPTQLAGIQNVNYAAGQAQPYFEEATNQLMGAQMAAVPYYAQAGQDIGYGQQYGAGGLDQATQALYAAQAGASPFNYAAAGAFQQGYGQGQGLLGAGVGQIAGAQGVAQPLQRAAQYNIAGAQDIGAQLAQQAYLQQAQAGQAAAPLQQLAQGIYGQAFAQAQPYNVAALQQYYGGLGAAAPISQAALANLAAGQQAGQDITGMALRQLGVGQAQATPIQQAALQAVGAAPAVAAPMTQAAAANLAAAQAGAQPYQQLATEFGLAGGRPVMPGALTGAEIGQFMSPYIQNVVAPTAALLNQQAQQAQAEQLGNAIRSGAFGGDRARIAAANLQQQQTLAQSKALSDIMQSGYGQALATAQQQQQLGLTAEQANRAAQQATAAQLLGIGQTGFGQGLGTAQQQAALAQQLYGQQLGAGQAQAALAQQLFGQGATAAQQQQAAAQALFGQSAQAAQQQAALAQQLFGQQAAAGQNIAGLGQQTFQQGLATGQAQQALAQQLFGQGLSQAQQQAALSQLLYGQGTGAAQQQAALAQQLYGQALGAGQGLLGAGQQAFQQGTGFGTAQQGLGQQIFGQGLSASQQAAALGQQGFAQQLAAAQARQGLGQGLYGMGAGTAQQLAALGTGAQGAALTGAQAQLAAGQAQQQTAQAGLQALYNQFLQQQAYPYQAAQFLANIATGTGALSGSTQTAVTPGGLLSDVRMKENIRKVGETFDKQPIYSYNYKGDDKTQMGMLAQEVEQKHPEAVGLAGGMKTVDYDKATRNSVRKPVTIDGEYTSSEGGPVLPHRAGEGFARGGYADGGMPGLASPTDMAALLAAQAQMFGPFSDAGRPTGGLPGMGGYVPAANLPVSELVTPGPMPEAPDAIGQMQKIADIGKTGQEIYEKYKEKQTKKSAADALNTSQANAVVSSDRRAAADGGSAVMPYTADQTTALNIPSQKMETKKLDVPEMPKGRSAMDDVAAIANIAATVMSMSDSRVKEDIKHIGNTYDGQKIYSYRYKGEPQTHIGLLAQEVEKKHPEAVGNIKGVKMVDYDMATEEAAKRAVDLARGKADGGAIMPYSTPTSLGIPSGDLGGRKLDVPDMPEGRSALDDLSKLASTASDIKSLTTKPKKYAGGRTGYATDGSVKDETDIFSLRHQAPGLYDEKGNLKPWAAATGKFLQERFVDNPAINPMAAMRRAEANARAQVPGAPPQTGLAAAVNAVVPSAQAANASSQASATTNRPPRRDTAPAAGANDARPVDNKDVFPASAFANLPETPAEGLAGATGQSPGVQPDPTGLAPSAPASVSGSADLGMAPMLGGTVKPTKAEVIAKDRSAPVENRMSAFLDWVKQPQNFIPLATGIAAATAAPTRNTFVALAQGLGAGAQAYQPVMQKQAELKKTRAETEKIGAEAGVYQANTLRELQQIANIRGLVPKEDPNGIYRVGEVRYSLVPVSEAIVKPSATGARPTGTTDVSATGVLGPNALQAAQSAGTRFLTAPETSQTTSVEKIDQSLAAGNKARNDLIDINRFAQSAALPRTPLLEQGALFPIKNQLVNFYDSLVTTFIQDPALREKIQIDPASMTQAQISEKLAFGTAALREAGAGQRSLGALEAFLAGNPNNVQKRETMVNLIADMIIHNQKLADEATAMSEFDRLVEANVGLPRSFLYDDAVQAYQKDKPITAYENDRDQLVNIMMNDAYAGIVKKLKDPKSSGKMIRALDKEFGDGFHRYFTGSRVQ